jgi:putative endonuclease
MAGCRYAAESTIVKYKMFSVYIIQSLKNQKYYIGHAEDSDNRLKKHNSGCVKSTKYGIPWKKVYTENYSTRAEAYRRELEIKSYKGGIKFKKLLGLWKE